MTDQNQQGITDDVAGSGAINDSNLGQVSGQSEPAPSNAPKAPSRPVNSSPNIASDSDLIEKEWVDKAKEIVEHTKGNPYEQQKAISKFKADYMKKRYNKDINQPNT